MKFFIPLLVTVSAFAAEPLSPELTALSAEARGILAHNCTKCHGQHKQKGGLRLDLRDAFLKGGENGPAFDAAHPEKSELLRRVKLPATDDETMPPEKGPIPAADIALLTKWLAAGAPWPDGETAGAAFQRAPIAPRTPAFPAGTEAFENPIDKFVAAYFRERKIEWPAAVDNRTFLRRASLDLVGLLPDWNAVNAFDGNRAKAVDALLARKPDYAAHWMSFWNDALRNDYSGVGYIDGGRSQISRWLYNALLNDMPYDQFVRELVSPVAGAEGFVKGIKWRGDVSAGQRVELQAAQSVGQVFLGVNVKCASCHDSFLSDYTLKDAHALGAVFSDKPLEIFRCDKPNGQSAKAAFFWPELGAIDAAAPRAAKQKQLAEILTKKENGRLARVLVNRLWAACFGRGLAEPVDALDNPPWSRDLLDWLAADFAAHGYSVTRTLRQIVTSRAYQLPSVEAENADVLAKASFVFHGPMVRRLSAEQFTDAVGNVATPLYKRRTFIPTDRGDSGFAAGAQWIWHDEADRQLNSLPQGKRYFRTSVEFPKGRKPRLARLVGSADNTLSCYVNGQLVMENPNWERAVDADATDAVLGKSGITVAVMADNIAPGAAGLRMAVAVWFEESKTPLVLATGPGWQTTAKVEKGWETPEFNDAAWTPAATFTSNLPWGAVEGFTLQEQSGFVRAVFVDNDPLQMVMGRPIRDQINMSRPSQATLLQALTFTNGKMFSAAIDSAAAKWSAKIPDAKQRLASIYQTALLRNPREDEYAFANAAPADVLWSILLLPEFQLIR